METEAEEVAKNIQEVEGILRSLGIEMKVGACGCCDSPWVTFKYKGRLILDNVTRCNLDTKNPPIKTEERKELKYSGNIDPNLQEEARKVLTEFEEELKEIEDFKNGKLIDGIDEDGYCAGTLNYGQPIEDYQEQLRGAIIFIRAFLLQEVEE